MSTSPTRGASSIAGVPDERSAGVPVWTEEPWDALPALERDIAADICVVGLGGSGLAAVHELRELGATVVGIDAIGVAGGAAGRNGGFLLAGLSEFHHDAIARFGRARATALYRLTIDEIHRMAAETPAAVRLTGSLRIAACDEEERDCRAQLAAMQADGLPVEWYEGSEGRGLLVPTDGVLQPVARCRTLARAAVADGAFLFERTPALDVSAGAVKTPSGRVRCGAVVVAVDGGLARLVPEVATRVRTARLQMLATAPTGAVRLTRPVYTRWGYDYWQQLPDGRLVLGGQRDVVEREEWTEDATPTERVQRLLDGVLERIGVQVEVTHRWAATVAFSDSGLPVLEEVRSGVLAAGAYSGTGNVLGALCGRAAARLALGFEARIAGLLRPVAT
jgi:gamma-glutamylputrescine oxidase